jgi:hypothetical protein
VNRAGADVRHRRGYLATASRQSDAQRSASLRNALRSPLEATALAVTVRVEPLPGSATDFNLVIQVDPHSIAFEKAGENWEGALDVIVAQNKPDGSAVTAIDRTVDFRMTDARHDQLMKQGFTLTAKATVVPDMQRLHVVVRDVRSSTLGSVVIPAEKLRKALELRR